MDVEIDKLEIKAGAKDSNQVSQEQQSKYSDAELQMMIEKCVERMLRQMMMK